MKKDYTVLALLLISSAIGVALGLAIYAVCSPKNDSSDSTNDSESSTSTEESSEIIEPSEPREENILYADDSGNVYKILSITPSKEEGRYLVIFQNIKTGGVMMCTKSYFDMTYHLVEG